LATKYMDWNHAISQANDCGNGILPLNVGCQNAPSQIQGDENTLVIDKSQSQSSTEVEGEETQVEPIS
jgi:hypothetical protein